MRRSTSVVFVVLAFAACGRARTSVDSLDASAPSLADADAPSSRDARAPHHMDANPPHRADASAPRSPEASPTARSDAGTPPDECVAPCLRDLMRDCTAPRLHTCYHDDGNGTLCDPMTGWSRASWYGGMAGSGLWLAHDGTVCLVSSSGGASPIAGVVYSGRAQAQAAAVVAVKFESDGKPVTMCGLSAMAPRYPYAGDAACAAWVTDPMQFDCDEIVSGSCPQLTFP
jgi:hypothetical protein